MNYRRHAAYAAWRGVRKAASITGVIALVLFEPKISMALPAPIIGARQLGLHRDRTP